MGNYTPVYKSSHAPSTRCPGCHDLTRVVPATLEVVCCDWPTCRYRRRLTHAEIAHALQELYEQFLTLAAAYNALILRQRLPHLREGL